MRNHLLLGLLLIINNYAYSQNTSNISNEVFDIKGIKMGMSISQLSKLIGTDGKNCLTRNLAITKQNKELTAMADVVYMCQSYSLYGRQTGFLESYFLEEKLSGMFISVGNTEADKEKNNFQKKSFPDFYTAIANKFKVQPNYAKQIPSLRGGFDIRTDSIIDKEGSTIFIDGQMITNSDGSLSEFKKIRLFFASKDYYQKVEQRLRRLEDLEKLNDEENRKKDL